MNGYDLKEKLEQYKNYLKDEEKSPVTVDKYLRDTRAFFDFLGGDELIKERVCAYKNALEAKHYAVRSVNSMMASVNSFLKWLGHSEFTVKMLRVQEEVYCEEERELKKCEFFRLLNAAKAHLQLYMVILTIAGTGIRISELKYFTVEAVREGKICIKCKNKIRTILITGRLRKKLLDYARRVHIKTGKIFITKNGKDLDRSNIWKQMKKLCEEAGVLPSKVFPHNLRRLFARMFYQIEKDVAKLADILGHSNIETTRIYIKESGAQHRKLMEKVGLVL